MAAARLTSDSIASDSRATDPVMAQAPVLSAMVASATTMEAISRRRGETRAAQAARRISTGQPRVTRANLRLPTCTT
jgi:hypothetical protein